uniref:Uncharacterized protein TCIL3000_7_5880 n=1 Tax=Trypanosoma congolense (strain IL3000) TaxID=1068625 RepID=G0UQW3_TRYCI|nr:unnamed protein product [Trypanosoma congolense IL3000]
MATEQNLESVTSRSHASTTITPLDTGAPVAGNDETDLERHSSAGQQSMSSRMLAVLSAGRPPWRCSLGSTSCPPNPRQPPPARPPSSARREVRRRSNSFCSNKNTLASSGADDDRVICGTVLDLENPVEKSQDVVGNGLVATDGGTWEDKGGNCAVASSSHGEIIARRFSARKILAPLTLCSSSTADEGCGYYDSHRHQREREQSKKQSQRHRYSQKEQEHLWQHQQRVEKRQRLREKKKREEEYSQKYKEYGERERRTRGRQMLEDLLGAFCHAITRRLIDVPAPHRYVTTPHYPA